MSLQAKLDKMREQFESKLPAETLTIMHGATNDLLASGIMDRVLKVGDKAPLFSLPDHNGDRISSVDLLSQGPLVVGFYRGAW